MSALGIISTNKATCRDCYRCVRVCPVKAIRISDGQAQVDPERCLVCGSCVRECPQHAKQVRSDLARVQEMVQQNPDRCIASIAPSYIAAFPEYGGGLFPGLLKKLGFALVTETAVGAEMVARETARMVRDDPQPCITSACPALVDLIARYQPWAIGQITPVVSPMIAHARYLKKQYGQDAIVVFIGPCPAKKAEAEQPDVAGDVDAVLTFEEIREWIQTVSIRPDQIRSSEIDDIPASQARLFPLEGGLAQAASMGPDLLRLDFAAVSGSDEVEDMLANIRQGSNIRLFEALFCAGGCINGACFGDNRDLFHRKSRLLQHEKRAQHKSDEDVLLASMEGIILERNLSERPIPSQNFTEEAIGQVLTRIGKHTKDDELNCGACGYATCRDSASAVLSGMAEYTMCIPWMRKLAERKADQIIDESPNGIVIVDPQLRIVEFNRAFAALFSCTEGLIGKPLSVLMDPSDFEKVLAGTMPRVTNRPVSYPAYHVSGSLNVYKLADENRVVGVLANVTRGTEGLSRLDQIREETLANAEQVIQKQMLMAQEIASILGETTSETRVLLRKLTELMNESVEKT